VDSTPSYACLPPVCDFVGADCLFLASCATKMDYQKAKKGKAKATQRIFIIVFWDVLPCKIIVDRRFRGTRQYIPEDNSELHTRRRENLKSHIVNLYGEATLRCIRRFESTHP